MSTVARYVHFDPGSPLFARRAQQLAIALRAERWEHLGNGLVEFFGVPEEYARAHAAREAAAAVRVDVYDRNSRVPGDALGVRAALSRHRR